MSKKFLGIDYGSSRIGLAVGDDEHKIASPVRTVPPNMLLASIKEMGPFDEIVVGLPRNLEGHDTPQTLAVKRFCDDVLWRQLHVDAVFQDEAASSSVAKERLHESGRDFVKEDIDAEAASIILQDYLDSL